MGLSVDTSQGLLKHILWGELRRQVLRNLEAGLRNTRFRNVTVHLSEMG